MDENSKENTDTNAKQGEEQGSENKTETNSEPNEKTGSDENTDSDVEQDAFDFVDLVFTGKRCRPLQVKNLKELTKKLKNNNNALPYIFLNIKKLIHDAENRDDKELKKELQKIYESLNNESTSKNDIPFYLRELKIIDKDFYYKIIFLYKINYNDNLIDAKKYNNIYSQLNENKRELYLLNKNRKDIKSKINEQDYKIENMEQTILNKIKEDVYPEFITILGIFTAITFAIFGGMNLLSNLFQNMRSTHASLGQALILASIFGFTLWGLIEILFIWISKINLTKVDKDNRNDKKEDCSGSDSTCINKKCLNKNCSNIDCSDEICLNKDCSNATDKEEIKIVKNKKNFYWFALSFLTITLLMGLYLYTH